MVLQEIKGKAWQPVMGKVLQKQGKSLIKQNQKWELTNQEKMEVGVRGNQGNKKPLRKTQNL